MSATRGYIHIRQQEQQVAFESSFERDFIVMCGASPQVRSVGREPFSIRYMDVLAQRDRRYTPDFLVELTHRDRNWELLVEVKREADRTRFMTRSLPAFEAAKLWTLDSPGRRFAIVTDYWMQKAGLEQLRMLHAFARTPFSAALRDTTIRLAARHRPLSTLNICQHIGESLGISWNEAMPTLLALIATGELTFDVRQMLTLETAIYVGKIVCPFADLIDGC